MNRSFLVYFFYLILLMAFAIGVSYFLLQKQFIYSGLLFILSLFPIFKLYSKHQFLLQQIEDFSEAVRYRDFTRQFRAHSNQSTESKLFHSFNTINQVFKDISKDKEIQYEYLNRVINMLESAILFYQTESGEVLWTNQAFKNLFQTPHLGKINALKRRNAHLYQKTMELMDGQQQIETIHSSRGNIKLLIQSSEYETNSGRFRMVVYQNINEAIDQTETEAWQKLLRVLTHEIMNSIGPISSLAETLYSKLQKIPHHEENDDLREGIYTIKNRSEGLIKFANSYRMINRVDKPRFQEIQVLQLFENVYQLLEPSLIKKGIDLDIIIKNTKLVLLADQNLIEQILINIVLNAIDAVKECENPVISLQAIEQEGKVQIKIRDNGSGMPQDILEQIFTPFFTTKKSGTGVGLTLSKQIMLLHKGNLLVESELGKGSVFILQFQAK